MLLLWSEVISVGGMLAIGLVPESERGGLVALCIIALVVARAVERIVEVTP